MRWRARRNGSFSDSAFTKGPEVKRAIAPEAFKKRVREITRRAKRASIEAKMAELVPFLRGWRGYFGFCETPEVLISLIRWVRLPLRLLSGDDGKPNVVVGQLCWNWESVCQRLPHLNRELNQMHGMDCFRMHVSRSPHGRAIHPKTTRL